MEDTEELISQTHDADPEVRGRAAVKLGAVRSQESFGALVDLLGDQDNRVRVAAVRSLGDLGDNNAVEPLLPLLEEQSVEIRCTVMAALAQIGDERAFAPIATRLFDVDDDIRTNAAAAIGKLRDKRAFEPLMMCLDDSVEWVRANSAWSLGLIGCPDALDRLRDLADSHDTPNVRANAVSAIGMLGLDSDGAEAESALEFVLDVLGDESEEPKVRVAAALVFGQSFSIACGKNPEVASAAFSILYSLASKCDDPDLQSTAIWCLGKICTPENVSKLGISHEIIDGVFDLLCASLESGYEWNVRYAIEALSDLGEERCLKAIEEFSSTDGAAPYENLCDQAVMKLRGMLG
ncbi:MAG: HEAT repeat domain-containing protein [Coriobacteriales bacterium]